MYELSLFVVSGVYFTAVHRLFIIYVYIWLCWVFISVCRLSLVAVDGLLVVVAFISLQSTGSRHTGSVVVLHRFICPMACGIFPEQGSNPCPPALAGRLLTTRPPGELSLHFFSDGFAEVAVASDVGLSP